MSNPSEAVSIEILSTIEGLEALVPEWLELWMADPHRKPFQRPEWLLPWWRHFAQAALRAATVRSNGRLIALLPLYIYPKPGSERQLLLLGAGTSDYLDGVYAPECSQKHVLAALRRVQQGADWDVAHLTQLLPHSVLFRALEQLGPDRATPYPGESCSSSHATVVNGLPTRLRSDIRYYRNAAGGRGSLALTVADAGSCLHAFEALVRLHTERWEKLGEPGVLADPAVLGWHRDALPALAVGGLLRLYTLHRSEELLGVLYALIDPERSGEAASSTRSAYFYLMGFSLEHARFHPGTLLTALAVEHAAKEGVATIDMLRGNETYKKFWHVQTVPTFGFALRREALSTGSTE